jgi:glycosyltransferase involved in cell wall biosynthesis
LSIVLILPNLRSGGSERVVVNLANEFKSRNFAVTIILILGNEMTLSPLLRTDITIIDLKLKRFRSILLNPFVIYNVFKKLEPKIVISAFGEISPLIIFFKLFFRNTKFIARESSIPSLRFENSYIKLMYKYFYNYYDNIVVQSLTMKLDLINNFSISPIKTILIKNPLDINFIEKKLNEVDEYINKFGDFLLYVGTIDSNKRLDKIISFYNKLKDNNFCYKLVIIGDGPDLINTLYLIDQSKYKNDIILYPYLVNPFKYMNLAKFLLIASNYEGFPNVGIEANYCGLPIILSHETKGGARELIVDNLNGLILDLNNPDLTKLKQKFDKIKIKEHVSYEYNVSNVVNEYFKLF